MIGADARRAVSATVVLATALLLFGMSDYGVSGACIQSNTGQFDFNGATSSMDTSLTATTLMGGSGYTLAFWGRRASNGTYDIGLSMGQSQTIDGMLSMGYRDAANKTGVNRFYFGFYRDDLDAPKAYQDVGVWRYWTATFNSGSRLQKLYRDGFLVNQRTAIGPLTTNGALTLRIGSSAVSPSYAIPSVANAGYWHGQLDEIAVFTRVISDAEVLSGHANSFISNSLQVLYLTFAGGSTTDQSPAGTAVTNSGAVYQPPSTNARCSCGLGLCGSTCQNSMPNYWISPQLISTYLT